MNKKNRRAEAYLLLRPITGCVLLALSQWAAANPTGAQVAAGSATFDASGKRLTITNTPGTILNWQSFSIAPGELTRFQQQSAASAVLNRVVAPNPSSILGTLSSNGRVFLVNPSGIVFGAGAVIDTAGFVASTLNISDSDFLSGRLRFEGGGAGVLRNEGTIRAASDIFLVGPKIENAGLIQSTEGNVVLAAGKSVTITSPDAHGVQFGLQAPDDSILNLGRIEGRNAVSLFAGTLHHTGETGVITAGLDGVGRVVLSAQKEAIVDGKATISADNSAGKGGSVQVLGEHVGVFDDATITARGTAGGGEILIGGDFRGQNAAVRNATVTYFGENAKLDASATGNGDGGKVIVWADDTTRAYGSIAARGGPLGGNGGLVETSGKRYLDVTQAPDTMAPSGVGGEWLLDPETITVSAGGNTRITGGPNFTPTAGGGSTLNVTTLQNAVASNATVTIDTAGAGANANADILFNVRPSFNPSQTTRLNLRAQRNIQMSLGFDKTGPSQLTVNFVPNLNATTGTATITRGIGSSGNLVLDGNVTIIGNPAGGPATTLQSFDVAPTGVVTLNTTGSGIAGTSTITLLANNTINLFGRMNMTGIASTSRPDNLAGQNGAVLNIQSGGVFDLQIDGSLTQSAAGVTPRLNILSGGIFQKSGNGPVGQAATSIIAWQTNNAGTIDIQNAPAATPVRFGGDNAIAHVTTGVLNVANGSTLDLNSTTGNTHALGEGAQLTFGAGGGTFDYTGTNLQTTGTSTGAVLAAGADLTLTGKTVGGTGIFRNRGALTLVRTAFGGSVFNEAVLDVGADASGGTSSMGRGLTMVAGAVTVVGGATLNLTAPPAGVGLSWQGGVFGVRAGAGTLNTDTMNVSTGSAHVLVPAGIDVNVTGNSTVASGATLTLNGGYTLDTGSMTNNGTLVLNPGTINGTMTNNGTLTVTGGAAPASQVTGGLTLNAPGDVSIDAGSELSTGATAITWNGGTITNPGAGTGTLRTTGTLNVSSSSAHTLAASGISVVAGTTAINSGATLTIPAGPLTPGVLNNNGRLNLTAGALALATGGSSAGVFDADLGTSIDFIGGAHTITGGQLNGAGNYVVTGAGTTLALSNVTSSATGSLTNAAVMNMNSSTFGGAVTNNAGASLGMTAGTIGGNVTNAGTLGMTNSEIVGSLLNQNALAINAGTNRVDGGLTLDPAGTVTIANGANLNTGTSAVTWNGGAINGTGTAALNAGSLTIATAGAHSIAGGLTVNVAGTTSVPAGTTLSLDGGTFAPANTATIAGTLAFNSGTFAPTGAVDNTGTITVGAGNTLNLMGGGTGSGLFDVAAGAMLNFANGATYALNGGSLNGAGTYNVNVGTTLNITGGNFGNAAGTLNNDGTLTLNGTTFAQTLNSTGTFTLSGANAASGPAVNLAGGTMTLNAGATLTKNGGVFNWGNGVLAGTGAVTLAGGADFTFNGTGAQTRTLDGPTLNLLTATTLPNGSLTLQSGRLNAADAFSIVNGAALALNGAGAILDANAISNSGVLTLTNGSFNPSGGTTTVNSGGALNVTAGNFTSGGVTVNAGGALNVTGGSFTLSNNVTHAGTFNATGGSLTFGGAGTTTLTNAAPLNGNGAYNVGVSATLDLVNGVSPATGTLTNDGIVRVVNSTFAGNLANTGSLDALAGTSQFSGGITLSPGSAIVISDGAVLSTGTNALNWQAGTVTSTGTGTLNLGSLNVTTAAAHAFDVPNVNVTGATAIDLGSTLTVNSGTLIANGAFGNAGAFVVNGGAAGLAGGGNSPGTFSVTAPATLTFAGGVQTLTNAAPLNGTGAYNVNGGATLTLADSASPATGTLTNFGTANLSNARYDGAVVNQGTLNVTGAGQTSQVSGGVTMANGTLSVANGATLTTGGSAFTWNGGAINGTGTGLLTTGAGAFNVATGVTHNLNGNVTVGGATNVAVVSGLSLNGGTFNANGGLTNDGTLTVAGATLNTTGTFSNTGALDVTSGNATANGLFQNSNAVVVTGGALNLAGGGTDTGTFSVNGAGASMNFTGGVHSLTNAAPLTGAGAYTVSAPAAVTLNGNSTATGTLTNAGTLNLANATYSGAVSNSNALNATGTTDGIAGGLTMTGGTLDVANGTTLTLAGSAFNWNAGALGTAGGNAGTLTTGAMNVSTGGAHTLNAMTLTVGGATTIAAPSTLTVGSGAFTANGSFNNASNMTVNGGTVNLAGGGSDTGTFTVAAGQSLGFTGGTHALTGAQFNGGGTFNVGAGATVSGSANSAAGTTLANAGTMNLSGGTFSGVVNNNNAFNVNAGGNVTLANNGTDTGTFSVANGGALNFTGGVHALSNAAPLNGTGAYNVSNGATVTLTNGNSPATGTLTNAGTLNLANSTYAGGVSNSNALHATGAASGIAGGLTMTGGTLDVATGSTLTLAGSAFNWSAGALGAAGLAGTLTTGAMNVSTGGAHTLDVMALTVGGPSTINGPSTLTVNGGTFIANGTFNNAGNVAVNGGAVNLAGGGLSAGTFTVAGGQTLGFTAGTHTLNGAQLNGAGTYAVSAPATVNGSANSAAGSMLANAGTMNLTGGTFSGLVQNTGAFNVNPGAAVTLAGGGTDTGAFNVGNAGTLNFTGPAATLLNGAQLNGSGAYAIGAGSPVTATNVTSAATGTLTNAGAFTVNTSTIGGAVTNTGTLGLNASILSGAVNNQGTLNATAGTSAAQGGLTLTSGAVNISGGATLSTSGSALTWNGGTLANPAAGTGTLNTGAFTVATAAPHEIGNGVAVNTTGAVNVNNGATLTLTGSTFGATGSFDVAGTLINNGTINTANPLTLSTGTFGGNGILNGSLNNVGGTVAAGNSPGALTVNGNYTQGPGGTMVAELGGLTQGVTYDVMNVTGTANLAGTLNVLQVNGFTAQPGQTFTIMTFASRNGDFTSTTFPSAAFSAQPTATSYPIGLTQTTTIIPPSSTNDILSLNNRDLLDRRPDDRPDKTAVAECR